MFSIALFLNAPVPIEVTDAGILIEVSFVVFANVSFAIEVRVAPPLNSTDVSSVQPENAPEPIEVITFSNTIEVSPLQSLNALLPMLFTEVGMLTEVIFEQPERKFWGIEVIAFERRRVVRFGQFLKMSEPIEVSLSPKYTLVS